MRLNIVACINITARAMTQTVYEQYDSHIQNKLIVKAEYISIKAMAVLVGYKITHYIYVHYKNKMFTCK